MTRADAAVLTGIHQKFEIQSFDVPEPAPGTFIVKVELAGICGTDAHIYHGRLPSVQFPVILGHELTGTIAALGEGVTTDYMGIPVQVGDRVAIRPGYNCGYCFECMVMKQPGRCRNKKQTYGFKSPIAVEPALSGGFAQYMYAFNENSVFFKTNLPPHVSVLMEPLTISLHAVERARISLGSTVIVQGTGAIGLFAIAGAKLSGAGTIIAIGGPQDRLELAKEFGADHTIDIAEYSTPEARRALVNEYLGSDRGASAVIGAVGFPKAFMEGLALTASGGVMAEVGHFTDNGSTPFNPYSDLLWRNCDVAGVLGAGENPPAMFYRSISILESGALPFDKVVSHQVPFSRIEEAVQAMSTTYRLDGRDLIKVAVNPWL